MKYLLISNICLSLFYLIYLFIKNNESSFNQLRFYLLFSILFSLLLPLSSYELNLGFLEKEQQVQLNQNTDIQIINNTPITSFQPTDESFYQLLQQNWQKVLLWIYSILSLFFVGKVIFQIGLFFKYLLKAEKKKCSNYVLVYSNKTKTAFSFFKWIFIPTQLKNNKTTHSIIAHEKIHVSNYHSIDLIIVELLAAVMWFNPIVWMMRKSLQLIHEYQADEGALSTGIDRLKYQALLLNHVCEERIICLSSSFNHSLIKKRMLMISKSKLKSKTKLRILALIPLTVLLFLGVGVINAQNNDDVAATDIISSNKSAPGQLLKISKITWTGNTVFDETQLNDALGYKIGDKYDIGDFENYHYAVQNRVTALYQDKAYAFVQAEIKEIQINASLVHLDISIDEGVVVKVGEIIIRGNKSVPIENILEKIEINSGDWFNKTNIIKSMEALKSIDKLIPEKTNIRPILDASKATKEYAVVDIIFTVVEKGNDFPMLKIGKITWTGNNAYSSSELNKRIGYKTGDIYNREKLENEIFEKENGVSSLYLDNGYGFFHLEIIEKNKIDSKEVNLTLKIYEGNKAKIGKINVEGNKKIPTAEILKEIDIKHGELYSRAKLSKAVKNLHLTDKFDKIVPNIMPVESTVNDKYAIINLSFTVVEKEKNSPALKIGKITWSGNTIFDNAQLNNALSFKTGDNYKKNEFYHRLMSDENGVATLYFDKARAFFKAEINEKQVNKTTVNLDISIYEGIPVKVGEIIIKGNKLVPVKDILEKVKIKSGDWFNKTKIIKSLGAISSINDLDANKINVLPVPDASKATKEYGVVDIEFTVVEKEKLPSGLKIGKITWTGNKAFSTSELNKRLGYKTGDLYDREKFEGHCMTDDNGINALYLDHAYIFFNFEIKEHQIDNSKVNLTINIQHDEIRAIIGRVIIKGNSQVSTQAILNKIDIKTGEWFNRKKIIKAVEGLQAMNKFIPEKIIPSPTPQHNTLKDNIIIVDLEFSVVEK